MHNGSHTLWMSAVAVVAAAGLVAVGARTAVGQERPNRPAAGQRLGPGPGPGPGAMLRHLNLTEAQREQVQALIKERRQDEAPAQKRAALERDLRAAIFADAPDPAKIDQLKAAILEADAAALSDRIRFETQLSQIFTAEQRALAREARGPHGSGRGGPRRGGPRF